MLRMTDFLDKDTIMKYQIDSYNWLIDEGLQQVINERKILPVNIEGYTLNLKKIKVVPLCKETEGGLKNRPVLEYRIKNITYHARMILTVEKISKKKDKWGNEKEESRDIDIVIGHIPIMLKSKICLLNKLSDDKLIAKGEDPEDPGGYFIINGNERVLIGVEDIAPNKIIVTFDDNLGKKSAMAKVSSVRHGFRSRTTVEKPENYPSISVSFPGAINVPFGFLSHALGLTNSEIMELFDEDTRAEILPTLTEESSDEAFKKLCRKISFGHAEEYQELRTEQTIDNFLLPHIGNNRKDRKAKAKFLAIMAKKAIRLLQKNRTEDDKDHYQNKRVRLAGDLLQELFRVSFSMLLKDIKYQLEKQYTRKRDVNVSNAVRSRTMDERIEFALATGNWTGGRSGISQVLDRTTFLSSISHRRRISLLLEKTRPHFEARDVHATQWGRVSANETPEGKNCGLVKNLTVGAIVSKERDDSKIREKLEKICSQSKYNTDVYVNGVLMGSHPEPGKLVENLREERRNGKIPYDTSIVYEEKNNEVQIYSDVGRVMRPLIVAKNLDKKANAMIKDVIEKKAKFENLVNKGVVEYLDAAEEEEAYIAITKDRLTKEHTHIEITPSILVSIAEGYIPFANYNSAPRVEMASAMAKQAVGIPTVSFPSRLDTLMHVMVYPQRPMVRTDISEIFHFDKMPAGQNFVVALLSYKGYNMEDAIVINQSSIERGMGRSTFYRTYTAEEVHYHGAQQDRFEIPKEDVEGHLSADVYKNLSSDGIILPETEFKGEDVLIGKTAPPRFLEEISMFGRIAERRREASVTANEMESGWVDSVVLTETDEGNTMVKIKTRSPKIPEIGDKMASRYGQKGVIGMIERHEDMPFTNEGIVPDLIMNPHAIPSRTTVGHLIEMLGGTAGCLDGRFIDGTTFENEKEKNLRTILEKSGFKNSGKQILYDGRTGEKIEAEIFIGVVYYQRLHHMVSNKIHIRAKGPVQMLTRQPTEGRAKHGGLRFGEMERDCLIGHGASAVLRDRLLEESDKVKVPVCSKCGVIAIRDYERNKLYCPVCRDSQVYEVEIPYAFKLLAAELLGLGIVIRFKLEDKI
ncbi:MAG: DNA-directed RNA polymerase subunit B [Candidatus Altiarchaeum hamiconexum]|uniref:DNA-directed RNA polymerase subunit Rpo2 n=1 Tax=Candidatus Altarchaeum hamiconexum TaxID=1803513 RepID=A0A8J7Z1K5_9ARCH|nr:DNA-directed RNA polymerase subunit B [Candidatus Altarchaeum hamiconexum]OIQ04596.1 MAG: DNA-directed RNA polymerase subunit B [Candidatus Altarchaeum sp. CG2_30_32_3053]PIV27797.1 MAG: DNA-directed RNA polymerase subunit B [Candidatus Altarchaeum sp. CG03_land_8_20_14_0_80_32_618]PIX49066.1 MAG: DNA-directed RNA polymerase subunit B [Candidatus Altarchaeum sp. CG_4_8_14_3_um_filter_33_2054]PIZ30148.1 MAG: DNA-directed RNA polymerase subunit B [Candidatus Altarchaeum sp. CG_4_10_14_0_8_um_f